MPERPLLEYTNESQKFSQQVTDYSKQYCNIYLTRLKQMTKLLEERIKIKWKNVYPICKLHKLPETNNEKCVVIGTLFKDQKLKPSILKELAEGNQLIPQPIRTHFTDESDKLYVEDELQRYEITGNLRGDDLVTGITCALLGKDDGKGKFLAEDCIFAGYRAQIERPKLSLAYILFISGLDLVNIANFQANLQLLTYWLTGIVDDCKSSKIARVVISGNSIRSKTEEKKPSISILSRKAETQESCESIKILDDFLLEISQLMDVDLMSGENDPSNHILPQHPMHHCMFPQSAPYASLNLVTNPYSFSISNLKITGTSGQPIHDILRFSDISDPLIALENCLKWNHLAPSAPDTLGCFPFYEEDPFIVHECPHVFFAGNQEKFATKVVEGDDGQKVRLICVPEFSKTMQVVLMDLSTLECRTLSFGTF